MVKVAITQTGSGKCALSGYDGEGLPDAVAAATRDGAKEAIAEVLRELFADPAVLAVLRGGSPPVPRAEPKPSPWARLKSPCGPRRPG